MKLNKILKIGLFIAVLLATIQVVSAQYGIPVKPELAPFTKNVEGISSADKSINTVLTIIAGGLVYLATPVAIIMIAFYGVQMTVSRGEQEGFDGAKKGLIWSIVGLIVILLSVSIVRNVIDIIITTDDVPIETTQPNEESKAKPDDTAPLGTLNDGTGNPTIPEQPVP